ncbi:hypothetical protein LUZ61_007190 [Rhynchospora tenuis]|uniref:Inositol-tetrakisphosphate 1-kinase n=1 Tax=Rhynchospora tenuis TaxID=198213 RepID=A0AAD5ZT10_9POAL|nr:hypothetical protein LUZ61_007190 [Rhynchospora tenuis]
MKVIGDLTGVRGAEMEEVVVEETIVVGSPVAGPEENTVVFGGSDVAEENWVIQGSGAAGESERRVVVGFALTKKKVNSFMQPKLLSLARKKGIFFVEIDFNRPLSEQGPFDVILHKLTSEEWRHSLEGFQEEHPEVTVLDPPYAIQNVYNRKSMLEEVAALNLSNSYGKVGVPKQLVVTCDPYSIAIEVEKAGLAFPIVAKPLVIDGTAKSHELSLAFDQASLSLLDPPLVLQEFVNHGGVVFKVYIVGDTVKAVRRQSLPNVDRRNLGNTEGIIPFPRVSCAAAPADEANLEPGVAEFPPNALLESLAKELCLRLGLRLFNVDIIRKYGTRDQFYVIDINYFPGFGKMPGYEHIFTNFLLKLVPDKYMKHPACA